MAQRRRHRYRNRDSSGTVLMIAITAIFFCLPLASVLMVLALYGPQAELPMGRFGSVSAASLFPAFAAWAVVGIAVAASLLVTRLRRARVARPPQA